MTNPCCLIADSRVRLPVLPLYEQMPKRNPTRPCAKPEGCDGTMRPQIGIPALRLDERDRTEKRNAWVCDKCGFEEPLKAITGTHLLLHMAAVVVFVLIVNVSPLQRWKLPIYGGLIVLVPVAAYLIARKADR